jgi:heme-degrading monooxygenase HmoA
MPFVAINVLTVPPDAGRTLEERFAQRAGNVDSSPGFEHFELLRPVAGTSDYLVYTRWRSRDDYEAWTRSQAFTRGHAATDPRPSGDSSAQRPAASGSTIWTFEVAQEADATVAP